MRIKEGRRTDHLCLMLGVAFTLLALDARAERLPIETYTTADGLWRDGAYSIQQDSRGFLWIGGQGGLSRFDGREFVVYTRADGLRGTLGEILETSAGRLYIGTADGVCRLKSEARPGEPRFELFAPGDSPAEHHVGVLAEGPPGTLYSGGGGGVFRFEDTAGVPTFAHVDMGPPVRAAKDAWVGSLIVDGEGVLWAAFESSLRRRGPDGRVSWWAVPEGVTGASFGSTGLLFEDHARRLWLSTPGHGLWLFVDKPVAGRPLLPRIFTEADGLPHRQARAVIETSDGVMWVGTLAGLAQRETLPGGGYRFTGFTQRDGLSDRTIQALAEDSDGNLWAGTPSSGVMKIAREGLTSWVEEDGLIDGGIGEILETHRGQLLFVGKLRLYSLEHRKLVSWTVRLPRSDWMAGWGIGQMLLEDHTGDWWLATGQGLCRWSHTNDPRDLARRPPTAVYTRRDGLLGDAVFRIYEDSRGDVWVSGENAERGHVCRWERSGGTFHCFTEEEGLPSGLCSGFQEDRAGNVWLGEWYGGFLRYRNGRFEDPTASLDGTPPSTRDLRLDHRGRLWIATGYGLLRIDDPAAARPEVLTYTSAQGLSSDFVVSIAEDAQGRIYAGTRLGVDRLDPETGAVRHYTRADGLPATEPGTAYRDRHGALWFSAFPGLSRLVPRPDRGPRPPPIYITALRVAGEERAVHARGATHLAELDLAADQHNVQVDFTSIGFRAGEALRFQTKLEGADPDWSPPSTSRTVSFAHLAPGQYRFFVRALDADGLVSTTPASVAFTLARPVWARSWFIALVALSVAALAAWIYHSRLARLLELERVRASIATDLHDDIGSSLSRIAIISEVARQRTQKADAAVSQPLETIAGAARELVDTMSDIVWAVDPKQDSYAHLVQRMRDFAEELCAGSEIGLSFAAADDGRGAALDARLRRQAFLVFKESVNNAVKHSACKGLTVRMQIEANWLTLAVADDGSGIGDATLTEGRGLINLRRRAQELGGSYSVESSATTGTAVTFRAPLRPSRKRRVRPPPYANT